MSDTTLSYGYKAQVNLDPASAQARLRSALAAQGFGVLTEIDVAATLAKKLNVAMRPYVILGACNPPFAYESIKAEPDLGLFLPCNLIVYENEAGQTIIAAVNPMEAMKGIENPVLDGVARAVSQRLKAVIAAVVAEASAD